MWELQIDWLYFRINWRIYIYTGSRINTHTDSRIYYYSRVRYIMIILHFWPFFKPLNPDPIWIRIRIWIPVCKPSSLTFIPLPPHLPLTIHPSPLMLPKNNICFFVNLSLLLSKLHLQQVLQEFWQNCSILAKVLLGILRRFHIAYLWGFLDDVGLFNHGPI